MRRIGKNKQTKESISREADSRPEERNMKNGGHPVFAYIDKSEDGFRPEVPGKTGQEECTARKE